MLGFLQFISWQYCWKGERRGAHSELTLSFWDSPPHPCPPSYLPAVACSWSLSGASEDIGILLSCCFFLLRILGCFVSPCLFIKYLTFSFHLQEICEISHLPVVSFFYNMSLLFHYYSTGVLGKGKKLCVQPSNVNFKIPMLLCLFHSKERIRLLPKSRYECPHSPKDTASSCIFSSEGSFLSAPCTVEPGGAAGDLLAPHCWR